MQALSIVAVILWPTTVIVAVSIYKRRQRLKMTQPKFGDTGEMSLKNASGMQAASSAV